MTIPITDTCGINFLRISRFLNECPKCKNPYVGKHYGSLIIDGYYITRNCRCGYKFKYDMREGKTTKEIQQAVKRSLQAKRGVKK